MRRLAASAPLLLDLGPVPAQHCDDCLEELFKALSQQPPGAGERAIWAPHENPLIRAHVEDVTRRLSAILERLQDAFARALTGEPIGRLQKADPPWLRWSQAEFEAARMRLEEVPPSAYTLDDWLLLVDYLVQRYLPDGVIQTEAEYLVVRAGLAGRVQAAMQDAEARRRHGLDGEAALASAAALLPTGFSAVPPRVLTPVELAILEVARARAAENISDVARATRHAMKRIVIDHVQAQVLGQREGTAQAMRQRLFDAFGVLNRDFRRIAVTEAGEACNSGFIAAQAPGTRVRRVEAYKGACDWCRSINGKVFRVVDPADPKKDGERDVWLGKTNVGRSASPRKRVGDALVEREPQERWWVAAGVQHPHCRGTWVVAPEERPKSPAGVSAEFDSWLTDLLRKPQAEG